MNPNEILGMNLKRLRMARQLSLGQLSALCGVSKIVLSQMERGESNPTMNTIWKIAAGLNVRYTELIDPHEPNFKVVRKENVVVQAENQGSYKSYSYYSASPERSFDLFGIELAPLSSYSSSGHPSGTEEYILLTSGCLEIEIGGITYRLEEGDAFRFDGEKPHIYRNPEAGLTKAVSLIQY
ncbi:helix-turn-helix transcriptional regulator [Dysosmobacter sp. Marseille-Q4140]|nr:helix-turn-helix transcriptional regulator [Dysosmobacter sp. Marseille-Q4140]